MKRPGLYAKLSGEDTLSVTMISGSLEERTLPAVSPIDDLLAALDIDYSQYRRDVQCLYEHPLFAEALEISEDTLAELVADVLITAEELSDLDPISYFVTTAKLGYSLSRPDDGTASFWLRAGHELVWLLEEPVRTQIRLRNMFEIAFDDMERATQQERYDKLDQTYPGLLDRSFILRPLPLSSSFECDLSSSYELRLLELLLYFRQDKRRIARCKYCGGFFAPDSRHRMSYCDRDMGTGTCKELGPNQQRRRASELDETKRKYDALRNLLWSRMERYETAAPDKRSGVAKMTTMMYGDWSEMAAEAYRLYKNRKLTSKEFLEKIDTFRLLDSHEEHEAAQGSGMTAWQQRIRENIDFDPEDFYTDMMWLDLSDPEAQWETVTARQLRLQEQDGGDTLKERYGK